MHDIVVRFTVYQSVNLVSRPGSHLECVCSPVIRDLTNLVHSTMRLAIALVSSVIILVTVFYLASSLTNDDTVS